MGIETSLSFKGLVTSPNHLGAASEGALVEADNVVIRFPDLLEPRRGLEGAPNAPIDASVEQVSFFDGEVVTYTGAGEFRIGAGTALTGFYEPADPAYRMKMAVGGQTLYATTDAGVIAVEEKTTTVPRVAAGIKAPVLPKATLVPDVSTTAIPGFLETGKAVAYRVLFGFKDAHGALHLGPASERVVVKNTTGSRASVKLDIRMLTAPRTASGALVSGLFIQVYRSPISDVATSPLDTMNLATEVAVEATTTAWTDTVEVTDIASQAFVAAQSYLYSSPEIGELPNTPPPFAYSDVATWSQRLWFANTRLADSLLIQLLGVGGGGDPTLKATGLRQGDTLMITSNAFSPVVLTGAAVTDPVAQTFKVVSSGTPDENVTETIKELADCINGIYALGGTAFDLVAYVTPGPFDVASQLSIQRNAISELSSVGFSVIYAAPTLTCTVAPKILGEQVITTATPHHLIVGDVIRFRGATPMAPVYDAEVTTYVSGTQIRVTPVGADIPTGYTRVRRRYAETVWNPDLSVGSTSKNDAEPSRVFYSKPLEYEAVPVFNYLDVGVKGRAIRRIVPQRDRLLVFKDEGTYAIFGDYPFAVQLVDDTVQILAPDSAVALGSTVFALMDDGIMAITEGSIQPVSEVIDYTLMPYLSSTYREQVSTEAFGVAFESQKLYALFMPWLEPYEGGYKARAYVYGLLGNAWTTWSYETVPYGIKCGKVDPVSDRGYFGTASYESTPSLLREKNTSTRFDYVDDYGDGTQAIQSSVRWAASTMGSPFTTKQVREVHLHFRQAECTEVSLTIGTDVVESVGVIPVPVNASTDNVLIGGYVKPKQFRMLVPQEQQRGAYFMLRFVSDEEAAYWALNGYSLVFETTSERTGTVR